MQEACFDSVEFGRRISEMREESGMTLLDAAHELGCSIGTLSNWERGIHLPKAADVFRLADLYESTPNYLLGWD